MRLSNLSEREKRVLELLQEKDESMSNLEIALEMGLDVETVQEILSSLMDVGSVKSTPDWNWSCSVNDKDVESNWERDNEEKALKLFVDTISMTFREINVDEDEESVIIEFKGSLRKEDIGKLEDAGFEVEGFLNSVKISKDEL